MIYMNQIKNKPFKDACERIITKIEYNSSKNIQIEIPIMLIPTDHPTITHQRIQQLIKQWETFRNIQYMNLTKKFKHAITNMKQISTFCQICVAYIIQERFQQLFKVNNKQHIVIHKQALLHQYRHLYFLNICKSDFKFYFLMVIATKITSKFIFEHFQDTKIDLDSEGQIFISLIASIIGIHVSIKSYLTTLDKYINKENNKKKHSQDKHLQRKDTIQSKLPAAHILKRKAGGGSFKRRGGLNRQSLQLRFSLLSQKSKKQNVGEDDFQSFLYSLKKNLEVPPLLPVIKPKLNLRQLEESIISQQQKEQYIRKVIKTQEKKLKKTTIKSNQLSLLYDNEEPIMTKSNSSFTIAYVPTQLSKHYCVQQLPTVKGKQSQTTHVSPKTNNNTQQKRRKSNKKWNKIINSIKDEYRKGSVEKLGSFQYKYEAADFDQLPYQKQISHLKALSQQYQLQISEKVRKIQQQNFRKLNIIEQFKQNPINNPYGRKIGVLKQVNHNSHENQDGIKIQQLRHASQLKMQKVLKDFQKQCQNRDSLVGSSIFQKLNSSAIN